jgi:peroxiredoxin
MSATNQNQEIDSLKIIENADGTFAMEWDKDDQKWNWLNGKTSAEISAIVEEAIQHLMNENDGL